MNKAQAGTDVCRSFLFWSCFSEINIGNILAIYYFNASVVESPERTEHRCHGPIFTVHSLKVMSYFRSQFSVMIIDVEQDTRSLLHIRGAGGNFASVDRHQTPEYETSCEK